MKIKVLAIGGGGGNAINHIIENKNLEEFSKSEHSIDFVAIDTDFKVFYNSKATTKIKLEEKTINDIGSYAEVKSTLSSADVVILIAGLGGSTESVATPIVAQIAKDLGVFTACIVTKPFSWEGAKRMKIANETILKIEKISDKLFVYNNDNILELISEDSGMKATFKLIDEKIYGYVKEIINQGK